MCAHAVRVAVRRIEGVEAVDVSLNQGLAVIRLRAANRATVEQIRQAIRDNGFTPKAAEVRISGTPVGGGDSLALAVPGQDRTYRLVEHPDAPGQTALLGRLSAGQAVTIEGRIPEVDRAGQRIEVRRFSVEGPGHGGAARQPD